MMVESVSTSALCGVGGMERNVEWNGTEPGERNGRKTKKKKLIESLANFLSRREMLEVHG